MTSAAAELLADGVPLGDLADWSEWSLARVGFRPRNTLPVVGVCRDELMLPFEEAVQAAWGPAFDASSLAALPLLGRTGIGAALGHTPGEDGRNRFVVFSFPHLGVDAEGTPGLVLRPGIRHGTTACGALVAARARLASGDLDADTELDPDDVEMGLLLLALHAEVGGGPVPDLVGLTEVLRRRAIGVLDRLVDGLHAAGTPVDHAMVSGIVVHGPHGADVAVVREAYVVIDRVRRDLPLG